jgi:uncharacterized protein Smg (DUF494 family)
MTDRYAVQRIMEIISFVMSELRQHRPLNAIDLDELQRRGYTDGEISAAFSWILERGSELEESAHRARASNDSFRILHGLESDLISPEAWGVLLTYQELGFLQAADVESVLDRAVVMGAEHGVSEQDIMNIIAVYLMNQHMDIDMGGRTLLDGSETIN